MPIGHSTVEQYIAFGENLSIIIKSAIPICNQSAITTLTTTIIIHPFEKHSVSFFYTYIKILYRYVYIRVYFIRESSYD